MDEQPSPGSALPLPVDQDSGLPTPPPRRALCLSGGGYRAALFHLGALRRLNELGVLARLDSISCVSGGSIIGAYLAQVIQARGRLDDVIPDTEWELQVAQPFRAFTTRNVRTDPLKQRLFRP